LGLCFDEGFFSEYVVRYFVEVVTLCYLNGVLVVVIELIMPFIFLLPNYQMDIN
jgi:hypothetical protein